MISGAPGLLVVSFYTSTWEYPEHAARLARECDALGLDHHIEELPDTGSYIGNCRLKPAYVRRMVWARERPVLWVDVDGSILAHPTALDATFDFMARPMPKSRDRHWHVGTLFFGKGAASLDLLDRWVFETDADPAISDELAFDRAWDGWTGRYAPLGPEYFYRGPRPPPGTVVRHRLSTSEAKHAHRRKVQGAVP